MLTIQDRISAALNTAEAAWVAYKVADDAYASALRAFDASGLAVDATGNLDRAWEAYEAAGKHHRALACWGEATGTGVYVRVPGVFVGHVVHPSFDADQARRRDAQAATTRPDIRWDDRVRLDTESIRVLAALLG